MEHFCNWLKYIESTSLSLSKFNWKLEYVSTVLKQIKVLLRIIKRNKISSMRIYIYYQRSVWTHKNATMTPLRIKIFLNQSSEEYLVLFAT